MYSKKNELLAAKTPIVVIFQSQVTRRPDRLMILLSTRSTIFQQWSNMKFDMKTFEKNDFE